MSLDLRKREAAAEAIKLVEPGMLVGLGSGTTAEHAIRLLGEQYRAGLKFIGVPTSMASAGLARSYGIPLIDLPAGTPIDLTIDGADEIAEADLCLIKGLGGALLWEKIVATMSQRMVIVADGTKLQPRLSGRIPVPVEIVEFGWESTAARLSHMGYQTILKRDSAGRPYRTDGGNLILHCRINDLSDPAATERALSMTVGVVETGLFIGLATTALVASAGGVRRIDAG
ncbi:MAG: ribose-5-phosphate isomerase RpiA [Acetobacteraceae bacterium]|nr:ribose-5-phosphate isomerase RpiA [Acetobacteraceae bacterium]